MPRVNERALLVQHPNAKVTFDPPQPMTEEIRRGIMIAVGRRRAKDVAEAQGHELGPWHQRLTVEIDVAYCIHCRASVELDLDHEPRIAGRAVSSPCQKRPDAFLANTDVRRI